jgi:hypothetical protein
VAPSAPADAAGQGQRELLGSGLGGQPDAPPVRDPGTATNGCEAGLEAVRIRTE